MAKKEKSGKRKRSPVVSGIYYPDNRAILNDMMASYGLKENFPAAGGQTILAPHGAWDLTGSIAASAFASVQKNKGGPDITRVLLLGTHHQGGEEGIYLSESAYFETPLGDLFVDQKLNKKLASGSANIKVNDIPHLSEHSLEVLLPLVKYCFPNALIVPILMSGENPALISSLAISLRAAIETYIEECLIIISSTVSQSLDPGLALTMANEFCSLLEDTDSKAFLARLSEGRISACGGALLGALLESGLLGAKRFSILAPLTQGKENQGETVYYGAFGA